MAERFKFSKDFDYKPTSSVTIAFPAGFEGDVVTGAAVSGKITNAVVDAALKAKAGDKVGAQAKPVKSADA